MYDQPSQPSLTNLFSTVIVFMIVVAYGFVSLNTEDALWFWPKFEETPQEIVVFCYGSEKVIEPGSSQFLELTALANESISGRKNWDSLSMSDDTYIYYQTSSDMLVLELRYQHPVRIHSLYKYFSNVSALVIPLEGRHSQTHAVFGRTGEDFTAGSLHIQNIRAMRDFLSSQGICTAQ
jgi:hypothetical protein